MTQLLDLISHYGTYAGGFMGFLVTAMFLPSWAGFIIIPLLAALGFVVHLYCEKHNVPFS